MEMHHRDIATEAKSDTGEMVIINETVPLDTASRKDVDVAAKFLIGLDSAITSEPVSAAEARRLLWKIDFTILPLIMVTVVLAAIDKVIISNAAIYGMKKDTHLAGNNFSWVGSLFYFGYLAGEFPAALLIQRLPVAKFFALTILCWSILMLCTAATHNFVGLGICRFFMGMTESVVFPVSSIQTVMWWTKNEQPKRVAFWFNSLSTVFSGIISYAIGHTHTTVAPWRMLFLVLGSFSVLWSIVIFTFLPNSPVECWFLSDREKFVALDRVRDNNTGVEDKKIKWYQVRECLLDPKTWLLSIFAMAQNIPNSAIVTFAAIIVEDMGYDLLQTVVIGIPTGLLATFWQILLAVLQSYIPNSRCAFIACADLVTLMSGILLWKLPRSDKSGILAAYYLFYTYWAPFVLCTSLPMGNTSGHSKKLTMNAVFFVSYCVGCIIGPQTFRVSDAPKYQKGFAGLTACIIVAMVSISGYGGLCWWENRQRDKLHEAHSFAGAEDNVEAFSDLTDKEKPVFRYSY